jgi:hypothetical protein
MSCETTDAARTGFVPLLKDLLRPAYYFVRGYWTGFNVALNEPRGLSRADASERESIRARGIAFDDRPPITLETCGESRNYVRTFRFPGDTIDGHHARIATAPLGRMGVDFGIDIGLDGYLARAEAMKLYELGYFASGDALELGTYMGLSASIVGNALRSRGSGELHTCDISRQYSYAARRALCWHPARPSIRFNIGDAPTFLDRMIAQGRTFGLVFVDHWHGYQATHDVVVRLPRLVAPGGFVMFHDYNDPSARDPSHPHKVFQAVGDGLDKDMFQPCCVVASSAVFQRRP